MKTYNIALNVAILEITLFENDDLNEENCDFTKIAALFIILQQLNEIIKIGRFAICIIYVNF